MKAAEKHRGAAGDRSALASPLREMDRARRRALRLSDRRRHARGSLSASTVPRSSLMSTIVLDASTTLPFFDARGQA